jgi:hypothetical protein
MASVRNLRGGAAGEPPRNFSHPFFREGVQALDLKAKNTLSGRILPAFDFDLDPATAEFKQSVLPYRDRNRKDPETDHCMFGPWYFCYLGYKFVGTQGLGFLSPLTEARSKARGIDPLFDTFLTAKNHTKAEYHRLTEKAPGEKNAVLTGPRRFYAVNLLVTSLEVPERRAVVLTEAGMEEMHKALNVYRPAHEPTVVDPNWEEYLLGDITDPLTGLVGDSKEGPFNDANMSTCWFHFSTSKDRLKGHRTHPIDPGTEEGQRILASRYNLGDADNIVRIATPEEILNYMVQDGQIPYELIEEACSGHWAIPPQVEPRRAATRAATSQPQPASSPASSPATPRPVTAKPASAPAPTPATVVTRKFWVAHPTDGVVEKTEAEARALAAQLGAELQVMVQGGEDSWHTAGDMGLLPPPKPAAPVAPPKPVAPPAPPKPAAPAAPAKPVAPSATARSGQGPAAGVNPPGRPTYPPRPAAATPAYPPRPTAPAAPAAPSAPPPPPTSPEASAAVPPNGLAPLSTEEYALLKDMERRLEENANSLSEDELQQFAAFYDRMNANPTA